MNFVVIGTDHRMQHSEQGFEALLRAFVNQIHSEPLTAIAEEYHAAIGEQSLAERIAKERGLRWFNVDVTTSERESAGILDEQLSRPGLFQDNVTFRLASDEIREEVWVTKLLHSEPGTTIVICGYLHFEALVKKLRDRGHFVCTRVYLETVPEIRQRAVE